MSSKVEMAETDAWRELIEETRQGLATLRAEDLEALAARAQAIFEAGNGRGPLLQGMERAKLAKQHRLLGELLLATEGNLEVLRRLRGGASDRTRRRARASGVDQRWVR
jgi:hypothetical protein